MRRYPRGTYRVRSSSRAPDQFFRSHDMAVSYLLWAYVVYDEEWRLDVMSKAEWVKCPVHLTARVNEGWCL